MRALGVSKANQFTSCDHIATVTQKCRKMIAKKFMIFKICVQSVFSIEILGGRGGHLKIAVLLIMWNIVLFVFPSPTDFFRFYFK